MAKRPPPDPRGVLERFAETSAPDAARTDFNAVQHGALRAARAGASGRSVTVERADARAIERAVGRAQTEAARRLYASLQTQTSAAATGALDTIARFIAQHDPSGAARLALRASDALARARAQRAAEDFDAQRHLLARWATDTRAAVHGTLEQGMRGLASVGETLEDVERTLDARWATAERIVRTETAYAFNAAADAQIAEYARRAGAPVRKRWVERVDDATGRPLDARVARDSLVLHGQVVAPDASFQMPRDPRVSPKLWGLLYRYPPNRPNDRAVVLPWRAEWGGIAWELRRGRRSEMT